MNIGLIYPMSFWLHTRFGNPVPGQPGWSCLLSPMVLGNAASSGCPHVLVCVLKAQVLASLYICCLNSHNSEEPWGASGTSLEGSGDGDGSRRVLSLCRQPWRAWQTWSTSLRHCSRGVVRPLTCPEREKLTSEVEICKKHVKSLNLVISRVRKETWALWLAVVWAWHILCHHQKGKPATPCPRLPFLPAAKYISHFRGLWIQKKWGKETQACCNENRQQKPTFPRLEGGEVSVSAMGCVGEKGFLGSSGKY